MRQDQDGQHNQAVAAQAPDPPASKTLQHFAARGGGRATHRVLSKISACKSWEIVFPQNVYALYGVSQAVNCHHLNFFNKICATYGRRSPTSN